MDLFGAHRTVAAEHGRVLLQREALVRGRLPMAGEPPATLPVERVVVQERRGPLFLTYLARESPSLVLADAQRAARLESVSAIEALRVSYSWADGREGRLLLGPMGEEATREILFEISAATSALPEQGRPSVITKLGELAQRRGIPVVGEGLSGGAHPYLARLAARLDLVCCHESAALRLQRAAAEAAEVPFLFRGLPLRWEEVSPAPPSGALPEVVPTNGLRLTRLLVSRADGPFHLTVLKARLDRVNAKTKERVGPETSYAEGALLSAMVDDQKRLGTIELGPMGPAGLELLVNCARALSADGLRDLQVSGVRDPAEKAARVVRLLFNQLRAQNVRVSSELGDSSEAIIGALQPALQRAAQFCVVAPRDPARREHVRLGPDIARSSVLQQVVKNDERENRAERAARRVRPVESPVEARGAKKPQSRGAVAAERRAEARRIFELPPTERSTKLQLLSRLRDDDSLLLLGEIAHLQGKGALSQVRAEAVEMIGKRDLAGVVGGQMLTYLKEAAQSNDFGPVVRAAVIGLSAHFSQPDIRQLLLELLTEKIGKRDTDRQRDHRRVAAAQALLPHAADPEVKVLLAKHAVEPLPNPDDPSCYDRAGKRLRRVTPGPARGYLLGDVLKKALPAKAVEPGDGAKKRRP